jgi:hypothetical protein
VTPDFLY